MKILNLGCGSDIHADALNVDFRNGPGVNSVVDLSKFPWPFDRGEWDEVRMFDFLEHFEVSKTTRILEECRCLLRDGGRLVVQVPDMGVLANALLGNSDFPCHVDGGTLRDGFCCTCGASDSQNRRAAIARIYGGQDYPGNYHMAGFTKEHLVYTLETSGFVFQGFVEERLQYVNWNMKGVAVKRSVGLWR